MKLASCSRFCIALVAGWMFLGAGPLPAAEDGRAEARAYQKFGEEVATLIGNRLVDAFARMIDLQAFGTRVAAVLTDDPAAQAQFVANFVDTRRAQSLSSQLLAGIPARFTVKFMRDIGKPDERVLLLRLDGGERGFDYVELVVQRDESGRISIVDWERLGSGERYSVTIGTSVLLGTDAPPDRVALVLGVDTIDAATIRRLRQINELGARGETAAAYAEIGKLPPQVAETRAALTQKVLVARMAGDDAGFLRARARLKELHGQVPATAFLLLSYCAHEENSTSCLPWIQVIEGRVGVDGLTHMLRSSLNIAAGRNAEALDNMRTAIRVEPEYFDAHFMLAMKLVELEQFGEAIKKFDELADGFGWQLSDEEFAEEVEFRKFVVSPEYLAWKR